MAHGQWIKQMAAALVASGVTALVGQANIAEAFGTIPAQSDLVNGIFTGLDSRAPDRTPAQDQIHDEVAAWRGAQAKQSRNAAIASWLGGLKDEGLADFSIRHLDKGVVYAIRLRAPVLEGDITALWVAVPDGPDQPSSIMLRGGPSPLGTLATLEWQSCHGRKTLWSGRGGLPADTAEAMAMSRLSAYLDQPDPMQLSLLDGNQEACHEWTHMLPVPGR